MAPLFVLSETTIANEINQCLRRCVSKLERIERTERKSYRDPSDRATTRQNSGSAMATGGYAAAVSSSHGVTRKRFSSFSFSLSHRSLSSLRPDSSSFPKIARRRGWWSVENSHLVNFRLWWSRFVPRSRTNILVVLISSFFSLFFYKKKIIFANFIDILRQVENFLFNDGLFIIEHGLFLPNKVCDITIDTLWLISLHRWRNLEISLISHSVSKTLPTNIIVDFRIKKNLNS